MDIWPRRLELKKETRRTVIDQPPAGNLVAFKLKLMPCKLFLSSKIPAPDALEMSPCLCRVRAQSFQNFSLQEQHSSLNMIGAKLSTKGI